MGKFVRDNLHYSYRLGKRKPVVSKYSGSFFQIIDEVSFERNGNRFSIEDNYYKVYRIKKRV